MRTQSVVTGLAICLLTLVTGCAPQTVGQGEVGDAGKSIDAPAGAESVKTAGWGQRYTFKDGLAVEVAAPTPCKPSQAAHPEDIPRAINFKITIINGSDKPVEAAGLGLGADAQFNGAKAEQIFDGGGSSCSKADGIGTILPGKKLTYDLSLSVPKEPGEMQLVFMPNMFAGDKGVFVGKA